MSGITGSLLVQDLVEDKSCLLKIPVGEFVGKKVFAAREGIDCYRSL